jgi:competence protein ComEA
VAAPPPPAPVQQSTVTRTGVDINTASVAELLKLPGIGKVQAQRIVAFRPFLSIQDLIRVGVPQKTINQLKPAVKDSATPAPAKK